MNYLGNDHRNLKFVLVSTAVFLLSLTVYCLTLLPGIVPGDPAELSLQASRLGVTHPPGYPLYIFVGNLFTNFFHSTALATNIMSALFTSFTVAVLSVLIFLNTRHFLLSFLIPLIFAFSPVIWDMAITTEVYNVNLAFLFGSFLCFYLWKRSMKNSLFLGGSLLFGLSLGVYFPNVMLIPAFIILFFQYAPGPRRRIFHFLLTIGGMFMIYYVWNYYRAAQLPPLGTTYLPTSLKGSILYYTANQYILPGFSYDIDFYWERLFDHAYRFFVNYLGIGILFGITGFIYQFKKDRKQFGVLLLIFGINFLYFTFYAFRDYQTMTGPSYFVFTVWIALGAFALIRSNRFMKYLIYILIAGIVTGLIVGQWSEKRNERLEDMKRNWALVSLEMFPGNAKVIAGWKVFTVLLYHQEINKKRPDVRIIEWANQIRYYEWGKMPAIDQVNLLEFDPPVIIYRSNLSTKYRDHAESINEDWFLLRK